MDNANASAESAGDGDAATRGRNAARRRQVLEEAAKVSSFLDRNPNIAEGYKFKVSAIVAHPDHSDMEGKDFPYYRGMEIQCEEMKIRYNFEMTDVINVDMDLKSNISGILHYVNYFPILRALKNIYGETAIQESNFGLHSISEIAPPIFHGHENMYPMLAGAIVAADSEMRRDFQKLMAKLQAIARGDDKPTNHLGFNLPPNFTKILSGHRETIKSCNANFNTIMLRSIDSGDGWDGMDWDNNYMLIYK